MSTIATEITTVAPPVEVDPEVIWHQERKKGVGGSEVHNLFPCLNLADKDDPFSRYACARRLSYDKLPHLYEMDYRHTEEQLRIFERGHLLEEYAADKYTEATGNRVFRANQPYVSKLFPFMRCNIDRRIKNTADGKRRILECKSAMPFVYNRMVNEGLPVAYGLQLQHSIAVTESESGDFGVIESPDFVDAVIEQIPEGALRSRILNIMAPKFSFLHFTQNRDEELIAQIVEREEKFWGLVEANKLADPLPDMNDERCKSCNFRRTCRGKAFADANAAIPTRDKKTGVQYLPVEKPEFVQIVGARLIAMKELESAEEVVAALDNEIKQSWPPETAAVSIPGVDTVKIRWGYQKGASRWDSDALKADAKTIGRKIAFADFVQEKSPELVAEFMQAKVPTPSLADLYLRAGAPTRPFCFTVKESE